jgi:Mg2+ and Co2+ transporter CorA
LDATEAVMSQTILFDGDHVEQLAEVTERPRRLKGSELLWVDVDRGSERDVRRIAEAFEIDDRTRESLARSPRRAVFHDHGRYIHVTTFAPNEHDAGSARRTRRHRPLLRCADRA